AVIYSARQREAKLQAAHRSLDSFRRSADSIIRKTVQFLDAAYVIHARFARKMAGYCRLVSDGKMPPGFETPSQMADSAAKEKVMLDFALKGLVAATGELGGGLSAIDSRTN